MAGSIGDIAPAQEDNSISIIKRVESRSQRSEIFLKLEKQTTGELDRRTLLETQQFLEQLMKEIEKDRGESDVQTAGQAKPDLPEDGEKTNNRSNLPGKEPGKKRKGEPSLPNFQAGATRSCQRLAR